MKKFGLIGHPISHSLSPALFKAAYGGKYAYELIEGDDFEKSYERFIEEYDTINVTAPFKELACAKADKASDECIAVGAANILRKTDGSSTIYAENSDIAGVTGALRAAGIDEDMQGKALVVGCGGAAMAATYAIWAELGYSTVVINRNFEKAKKFVERMTAARPDSPLLTAAPLDEMDRYLCESDVIIYTLPIAIPALDRLCRSSLNVNPSEKKSLGKIILEANYKDPAFTPEMLDKMHMANPEIRYVSGKEWLLHQAIGAYKSFTGEEPNIEAMRKVL